MADRRTILTAMLAVPAAVGLGSVQGLRKRGLRAQNRATAEEPTASQPPATMRLAADQRVGDARVVRVVSSHFGAAAVVLELNGRDRFQVDVLGKEHGESGPVPIAVTERFSLFISNIGDGAKRTTEERGLAVMALARVLEPLVGSATYLTFTQRQDRFGHEALDLPLDCTSPSPLVG